MGDLMATLATAALLCVIWAIYVYVWAPLLSKAPWTIKAEKEKARRLEEEREAARAARERQVFIQELVSTNMVVFLGEQMITCSNGHRYKFSDFCWSETSYNTTVRKMESTTKEGRRMVYGFTNTLLNVDAVEPTKTTSEVPVMEVSTVSRQACPTCKSSVFTFDDPKLNRYSICLQWHYNDLHSGVRIHQLLYDPTFGKCPLCSGISRGRT